MIQVRNNIIPFPSFKALTMWPIMFIRKSMAWAFGEKDERHENIHGSQQKEMLCVAVVLMCILAIVGCSWWSLFALPLFYYWYGIEWLIRYAMYRNATTAYKNIAYEQEAYDHQNEIDYLDRRKPFAWVKYLK